MSSLLLLLLQLAVCCSRCAAWYQMTNLLNSCNGQKQAAEAGLLQSSGFTQAAVQDCDLLLKTKAGHHTLISIEKLQVRNTHLFSRKCDNYLQIFSGTNSSVTDQPITKPLCSHERSHSEFVTALPYVRLHLHTSGSKYVQIKIAYTSAAKDSSCPSNKFKCHSSGYCIGKDLICDTHNNCGDFSDENHSLKQCQIVTYYHVSLTVSLVCSLTVVLSLGFATFYCLQPRQPRWYRQLHK